MAESSEKVVMADPPLIAHQSLQWNIILDIPEDQQEVNGVEEENWTLQFPFMAYSPIPPNEKLEISLDEHQEENNVEEKKWTNQIPKGSVTSTGNTNSTVSGLEIPNASLLFGGKTEQRTEITGELFDSEEEGSEYDERSEKSEHSSLQAFEEPDNSLAADSTEEDENLIAASPKAGPSNEPTRHREKKNDSSNPTTSNKRTSFKGWKCPQCERQFKRKQHFQKHLMSIHKIDRKQLDRHGVGLREQQVFPFKCNKCESSFKQKRTLVHHVKHECGVAFNCSECKKNFASKCSLRFHLLDIHKIARQQLDQFGAGYKVRPIQPHKCDRCERTYSLKSSLTRHIKAECGVEPSLTCPECNHKSKRKSDLKTHLLETHSAKRSQLASIGLDPVIRRDRQFKCDQCGRSYKQKRDLKRHLVNKCGK